MASRIAVSRRRLRLHVPLGEHPRPVAVLRGDRVRDRRVLGGNGDVVEQFRGRRGRRRPGRLGRQPQQLGELRLEPHLKPGEPLRL